MNTFVPLTLSTKRLNELRQSVDFDSMIEKEGELQELEKDTHPKIISDKDRGDVGNTQTVNIEKKKEKDTETSVGDGDEKVVNGGGVRSGASSPSPSVGTYVCTK